jgi:hypothetical protein
MANHPLPAPDVAREWLQTMMLIRRFEERAGEMYAKAKVGGFLHLAIGEEATIVGSARAMRDDDYLISTYRSHGHALVRGTSPEGVMAELFGRVDGVSKGRGGSMHMFDLERRFMGGYGIVGGNLPIAAGFGLASDYLGTEDATLCTFGDAVDSAFQKSGSCKCSQRARSCNPLYPSWCSRSPTFHHRYRYPPLSAASLIACWTLLIVRNVKIFGPVGRSGVRPAATERLARPTRIPTPTATATVTSGRYSTSLDRRRSASFARDIQIDQSWRTSFSDGCVS